MTRGATTCPEKVFVRSAVLAVGVALTAFMAAVALAAPKPRQPDLVTQSVAGLSAGTTANSTLALTAKVANRGTGKAKRSHLTAALSVDRKPGDDTRLGTGTRVKALKPRRKARVALRLALPAEISPGSYFVLVCADGRRVVRERNERNNCRPAPTTVGAGGALPAPPSTPAPPTAGGPTGTPPPAAGPGPAGTPTATPEPTPTVVPGDTTPPDTRIASGPPALTNSSGATLSIDAEPGATFECQLNGGEWQACASPVVLVDLDDGDHVLRARAIDAAGNRDDSPAEHRWKVDTSAPGTEITGGPPSATQSATATLTFAALEADATLECRGDGGAWVSCASPRELTGLAEGEHTFEARAVDQAGNADPTPASWTWRVDVTAPQTVIDAPPAAEIGTSSVSVGFSSPEVGASFQCRLDAAAFEPCSSPVAYTGLVPGPHVVEVRAEDQAGNVDASPARAEFTYSTEPPAPGPNDDPPPDPADTAPEVSPAADEPGDLLSFLYDAGPNATQVGVAAGAIPAADAVLVRGRVTTRSDQPVAGARVTVLDKPGLGRTATREDGRFDLVVTTGRPTLSVERKGYLSVQRRIDAQGGEGVEPVELELTEYDEQATTIDLDQIDGAAVAEASPVTDADGTRQGALVFSEGTEATMTLPDGTEQPLDDLTVRSTEYTTGADGEEAMPGSLPPTSGYTYAAEFSIDQAVRAGATKVEFDKPVAYHLDNFLGFPTGEVAPVGSYDRERGLWRPEDSGRVVELLDETDGVATVDTDGDGVADTGEGLDEDELRRIAERFQPGDSFWRIRVEHFSSWDINWGVVPPDDAEPPPVPKNGGPKGKGTPKSPTPCTKPGSVIDCERQTFGEDIPVAGTPFSLHYESSRAEGYDAGRVVPVAITGDSPPASLERVDASIEIAGRTYTHTVPGNAANQTWNFEWDGLDAFGREVTGEQTASVKVSNVYKAGYAQSSRFGYNGNGTRIEGVRGRGEVSLPGEYTVVVEAPPGPARETGIGGWTLDQHHRYEPRSGTTRFGTGADQGPGGAPLGVRNAFDGRGTGDCAGKPTDVEVGPDGAVWFGIEQTVNNPGDADQLCRLETDGTPTLWSTGQGHASGFEPLPGGRVATSDFSGAISILDEPNDPSPEWVTGDPDAEPVYDRTPPDGTRARRLRGLSVRALASAPDGALVFAAADRTYGSVYRVNPDGLLERLAGFHDYGDEPPARSVQMNPSDVAVEPDGDVLVITEPRARGLDAYHLPGGLRARHENGRPERGPCGRNTGGRTGAGGEPLRR